MISIKATGKQGEGVSLIIEDIIKKQYYLPNAPEKIFLLDGRNEWCNFVHNLNKINKNYEYSTDLLSFIICNNYCKYNIQN